MNKIYNFFNGLFHRSERNNNNNNNPDNDMNNTLQRLEKMINVEEKLREFDTLETVDKSNEKELRCICMVQPINTTIACGHKFCRLCLLKIFQNEFKQSINDVTYIPNCPKCPLCRCIMHPKKD
jgi:hypothetical protein